MAQNTPINPNTYHTLIGRIINDDAFRADVTGGDEILLRKRLAEVGISNPPGAILDAFKTIDAASIKTLAKSFDPESEMAAN